jgi:hypothetical protein
MPAAICGLMVAAAFVLQSRRDYFFLRKKKFWNAAMASGERIRSPNR